MEEAGSNNDGNGDRGTAREVRAKGRGKYNKEQRQQEGRKTERSTEEKKQAERKETTQNYDKGLK